MLAFAHRRLSPCTFIFSGWTSAKMPVQPSLLHLSCAPPDKLEQRGQPSCNAVPSVSVGGPKEPAFGGAGLTLSGLTCRVRFQEQLRCHALRSVGQLRESRFRRNSLNRSTKPARRQLCLMLSGSTRGMRSLLLAESANHLPGNSD